MDGSLLLETDPAELCFDDEFIPCSNVPLGSTCYSNSDANGKHFPGNAVNRLKFMKETKHFHVMSCILLQVFVQAILILQGLVKHMDLLVTQHKL